MVVDKNLCETRDIYLREIGLRVQITKLDWFVARDVISSQLYFDLYGLGCKPTLHFYREIIIYIHFVSLKYSRDNLCEL